MPQQRRSKSRPPNLKRIEKLYSFFNSAEKSDRRFTIIDVCNEVGYEFGTAEGYRTKKWFWFLHSDELDIYYCRGLHRLPKAIFIGIHQQKMTDIIGFLLAFFSQERRNRRTTKPLPPLPPPPPQVPRYHPLPWLFLLLIIAGWYRVSRKLRIRVWRIYLPL